MYFSQSSNRLPSRPDKGPVWPTAPGGPTRANLMVAGIYSNQQQQKQCFSTACDQNDQGFPGGPTSANLMVAVICSTEQQQHKQRVQAAAQCDRGRPVLVSYSCHCRCADTYALHQPVRPGRVIPTQHMRAGAGQGPPRGMAPVSKLQCWDEECLDNVTVDQLCW